MIICTVPSGPEQLANKLGPSNWQTSWRRGLVIKRSSAMEPQGNPYPAADTLRA
jgi:hypothetical protein